MKPNILVLAGSLSTQSLNKKVARLAAEYADKAGAQVRLIDLNNHSMPLFSDDVEADVGVPEAAKPLKQWLHKADGLIISSPEYNGSITAALKNWIDWLSRADQYIDGYQHFKGKAIGLLSASPGQLGGMRGLSHLRDILTGVGAHCLPNHYAIGGASKAFDDSGGFAQKETQEKVTAVVEGTVTLAKQLKSS